jgi:hypothetical protein
MAQQPGPRADPRPPWTRQRVLRAAIDLADQDGIESLSMRKLSQQLGGAPMSLYNHIANKDDLLDGMIDAVFSEIERPSSEDDWNAAAGHLDPHGPVATSLGHRSDELTDLAWSSHAAALRRRH